MLVLLETFEVENMIVFLLEYLGKIKWESLYIGLACVILLQNLENYMWSDLWIIVIVSHYPIMQHRLLHLDPHYCMCADTANPRLYCYQMIHNIDFGLLYIYR